jgi:thiol:disulfide interchange protein DsbD
MRKKSAIVFLFLLMLSQISLSHSQGFYDTKFVTISGKALQEKIMPGSTIDLKVKAEIAPEYHINSNKPSEEYLIPTVLKFEPLKDAWFGNIVYPRPETVTFSFSEEELSVYQGDVTFSVKLKLTTKFPLGKSMIKGTLSFQVCNDQNCFAPMDEKFEIPIEVVAAAKAASVKVKEEVIKPALQTIKETNPETTIAKLEQDSSKQQLQETQQLEKANVPAAKFTSDELKAKKILEKGLPYAIIAFFIFGLALNLTPCVYPVIPLTVGYFGGQSGRSKGSSFIMALFYVVGIAIVFAILGLISGLVGKQWGFLFQNPWFVIVVTTIILAMAASMFGAFEITVPAWLSSSLGKSREGNIGALIMGLTVGVVIAPCAAGIIIGLVGLVAKLGIVAKGTLLFFIMGLGLGLPYLILATFSGLLTKLPQSGMWMVWVRKLFGVLLIGVALYFFLPQAKHIYDQQGFFFGLLAIFGGLLLGFLDHAPGYTKTFKIGRGIFGVLMMLFGIFLVNKAIHAKPSELNWIHYQNETITELQQEGKPIFIDFYADWCAPCKKMDRTTFKDEQVIELSKQINMVKVDCTAPDEIIKKFMFQFDVTGMPTLVFIDKNGKELLNMREIGYLGADKFLEKMNRLLE